MEDKHIPWFVRPLFPDVVIPVATMVIIIIMSALAIYNQVIRL